MDEIARRTLLATAALGAAAFGDDKPKAGGEAASAPKDRDFVIAAGMTAEEADCWTAIADATGKIFALPKLHPMDDHEVAHAVHVIQNKLLARPTYRKYLELAKKAHGEKKAK
jgi:hypothetical protein